MKRTAVISQDEMYRYALGRQWDEKKHGITWLMLNPSMADAEYDDPTIRRCIDFSVRWGFGCMNVVNLFAFRTTFPIQLKRCEADRIGPQNDAAIAANAADLRRILDQPRIR